MYFWAWKNERGFTTTLTRAGSHGIPVHRPILNGSGSYGEPSVLPVSVGWGGGFDEKLPKTSTHT